jgi:folate-dependent phosphoribosylglycinamide formyltransferase PurN
VILAGEKELRSSTHVVREKVDQGEVLVVSRPVPVHLPKGMTPEKLAEDKKALKAVVDENQERLKRDGDWEIYPLTIQMIGEGRFTLAEGIAFLDGKPSPRGLRLG